MIYLAICCDTFETQVANILKEIGLVFIHQYRFWAKNVDGLFWQILGVSMIKNNKMEARREPSVSYLVTDAKQICHNHGKWR